MKLVAVATAPDQLTAETWAELLRSFDVPAVLEAGAIASFLGVSAAPCRVMVPEDMAEMAADILWDAQGDFNDKHTGKI